MKRPVAAVAVSVLAGGAALAHGEPLRPGEHAGVSPRATSLRHPDPFVPRPVVSEASRSAPVLLPTTTETVPVPVRTVGRDLEVTGYCLTGVMADGERVHPGAAASDLYPLGTRLVVPGFGTVTVEDRSAPGATDLDLWMASCAAARQWGRRWVEVEAA